MSTGVDSDEVEINVEINSTLPDKIRIEIAARDKEEGGEFDYLPPLPWQDARALAYIIIGMTDPLKAKQKAADKHQERVTRATNLFREFVVEGKTQAQLAKENGVSSTRIHQLIFMGSRMLMHQSRKNHPLHALAQRCHEITKKSGGYAIAAWRGVGRENESRSAE